MKKIPLLLGVLALLGASCSTQQYGALNTQPLIRASAQGRVVVSITDAEPTLQNITAVQITVDKVELHSTGQGWVNITSQTKTYDLMQLKLSGVAQLLADANVAADTYDQLRLHISQVTVTQNGQVKDVKLPSNSLKLVGKIVVVDGKIASVKLDFLLDKSLHLTGSGTIIMLPVIKLESKSDATVKISTDNSVESTEGKIEDDKSIGTDENGENKEDFEVKAETKLEVLDKDGTIKVEGETREDTSVKITAQQATDLAQASGQISVALSVKLETNDGQKVWKVTGTQGLSLKSVYVDASTGAIVKTEVKNDD